MIRGITNLQPTDLSRSWSSKRQHMNDADGCQSNWRGHWLLPHGQGLLAPSRHLQVRIIINHGYKQRLGKKLTQTASYMLIRVIAGLDVRAWLWIVENPAFELFLKIRIIDRCIRWASSGNRRASQGSISRFPSSLPFQSGLPIFRLHVHRHRPIENGKGKKYFICRGGHQIAIKGDSNATVEVFSRV